MVLQRTPCGHRSAHNGDDVGIYGCCAYFTADQCREWLHKPPFNPWIEPEKTPVPARQVQPPQLVASAGTVIEAPSKPAELSAPEVPAQPRTPRVPASSPWRAP